MSVTRRLAAGIPAAGVTVLAAFAFAAPATAAPDVAVRATDSSASPCVDDPRTDCSYGYGASASPSASGPTRGNGGYGTPSPTPSATVTSPPGGVSPTHAPPPPGGVSAGHLPVTGAPMGATAALGGLLLGAGGAALWLTRRRRSA
ncbi:LPXTG cell wall anchor domain-containing protein [Krasilnikovia sp. M28-CT-15]|uniref:LPXTG cell wall anchor domain-containing protein n=1 Tax=Krasilnikovia sp. M28-CT-15 TaxID=3373540 RepID=UPI00387609AF